MRPVPPYDIGIVEQSIDIDPELVTGFDATVKNGVDVDKDTDVTVPSLGVVYSKLSPVLSTVNTCPGFPNFVWPVPPDKIGNGIDDNEISNDPEEVIVFWFTVRNSGTESDMDDTEFGIGLYSKDEPDSFTVKISNGFPSSVKPVPPWEKGIVEQSIDNEPEVVIGIDDTDKNGVDVTKEISFTYSGRETYCKLVPFSLTDKTWFGKPILVWPVPPDEIGKAFDDKEISNFPEDVIVSWFTVRNSGTIKDIEVTVPVPDPSIQSNSIGSIDFTAKICPCFTFTGALTISPDPIVDDQHVGTNGPWEVKMSETFPIVVGKMKL